MDGVEGDGLVPVGTGRCDPIGVVGVVVLGVVVPCGVVGRGWVELKGTVWYLGVWQVLPFGVLLLLLVVVVVVVLLLLLVYRVGWWIGDGTGTGWS